MTETSIEHRVSKLETDHKLFERNLEIGSDRFDRIELSISKMADSVAVLSHAVSEFTKEYAGQLNLHIVKEEHHAAVAVELSQRRYDETTATLKAVQAGQEKINETLNRHEPIVEHAAKWKKLWDTAFNKAVITLVSGGMLWAVYTLWDVKK